MKSGIGYASVKVLLVIAAIFAASLAQLDAAAGTGEATESTAQQDTRPRGLLGLQWVHQRSTNQVRVRALDPGRPAEEVGLAAGDILLAINGEPIRITSDEDALRLFEWLRAGDRVELTVRRGAEVLTLGPVADEMPSDMALRHASDHAEILEVVRQQDAIGWLDRMTSQGAIVLVFEQDAPGSFEIRLEDDSVEVPVSLASLFQKTEFQNVIIDLKPGESAKIRCSQDDSGQFKFEIVEGTS